MQAPGGKRPDFCDETGKAADQPPGVQPARGANHAAPRRAGRMSADHAGFIGAAGRRPVAPHSMSTPTPTNRPTPTSAGPRQARIRIRRRA